MSAQLRAATAVRVTELVAPPGDLARTAVAVVATAGLIAAALATAATRHGWATFALLALSAGAEVFADRDRFTQWLRRRVGAGAAVTTAVRGVVVTLAAARTTSAAVVIGAAVVTLVCVAAAVVDNAAAEAVARERRPPILTRNVPLDVVVPHALHRAPLSWASAASMPVAAAGVASATGTVAVAVLLTLATGCAVAGVLAQVVHLAQLRRHRVRVAVADAARDALAAQAPQVLLYFAAAPEEVYQLDMWLAPVERCGVKAAVVVREPEVLRRLAPTSLPVYCVEHNGTMAALPLPERVVALFPTHSGNNLAMLRRAETRSVFVGHGDSDKPDSSNPYARVYDQVWVAGPSGRARYAEADVGVRPESVVEVGRPQLPVTWPAPAPPLTVLYAPTWEGWGDDPHHTSLPHVGTRLVESLLQAGVRVVYRPHPLTGVRNVAVRRADEAVTALLRAAGGVGPEAVPAPDAERVHDDLLGDAVASGRRTWSRDAADAERAEWVTDYWAAAPGAPRIVTGAGPDLHACFAIAHALVTDVSSVASDWLSTDRPYALVDTRGLGADELRRRFPIAAGAHVLGDDLTGLDGLLAAAQGQPDPTRDERHEVRAAALGDARAGAFGRAVRQLLG